MRSLFTIGVLLGVFLSACNSHDERRQDAQKAATNSPPELFTVTAESADLLFRYKGPERFETATKIDDIPEAHRAVVQVIDLSLSPDARGAQHFVQIFDLRKANAQGQYSGWVIPRNELEKTLRTSSKSTAQQKITMYSASWCGVCTKARKFLTKNGIAFVEKDIEKDRKAARTLATLAQAQGVQANGVPVFEIGGRLFNGFDPQRILAAAKGTAVKGSSTGAAP